MLWRVRHAVPSWHCLAPATQPLSPSPVVDQDAVHTPLARRLLVEAEIPEATNTAIRDEIEAMDRAAKHAANPKAGFLGYSVAGRMALLMRAGQGLRLKPAGLKGDKTKAAKKRRIRQQTRADKIWSRQPDLSKRDVAKQIADEEGHGHWTWIERIIVKK